MDLNKARAKVFAHLISMPVQLKYLLIKNVEWLFHIVQYVSIYYIFDSLNFKRINLFL
jgi:hypothetical protein